MRVSSLIPLHTAGTLLLLGATFWTSTVTAERRFEALEQPLESISRAIADLTSIPSADAELSAGVLKELRPTSYLIRRYTKGPADADLFIAFYGQQRAGESMHSPKHCLPGSGWEIWESGRVAIPLEGRTAEINLYRIGREGQRLLMLYWYQSRDRIVASEYQGKLLLARDALFRNSTAAAIVRVTVPDRPGAEEEAKRFAAGIAPEVQRCFGARR